MVVSGGYIGVEVAETLRGTGRDVRLIEAAPSILAPFDPPIRDILHRQMEAAGISVHTGEALQEILPNKNGSSVGGVVTVAGTYPADLVLLALGVRPCAAFLADTGIRRMKNGAIEVDREMRTSLPDVYAAGDCAGVYNRIAEQNVYSALGTVANKCGRIAGENMLGAHVRFDGCLGSSAISVCGMEAARTGLGEAAAGLPFMPVRGLVVSDLLRVNPAFSVVEDSFGSGPVAVVKALRPDAAILHVHRCDSQGNAIIDGPRFEDDLCNGADAGGWANLLSWRILSYAYGGHGPRTRQPCTPSDTSGYCRWRQSIQLQNGSLLQRWAGNLSHRNCIFPISRCV